MAKKAELLEQARGLGLEVTEKNTVAEIELAISENADGAKVNPEQVPDSRLETHDSTDEVRYKKSGKGSKKADDEAKELAEKEARKEAGDTSPFEEEVEESVKKGPTPVTRPRIERRSKNYRKSAEKIDSEKSYTLEEAVKLAKETSTVKFDASVELHVNLGVDPKHADQNIRGGAVLPNGTGKTVRVAVLADEEQTAAAKKAGADIAKGETLLEDLDKEIVEFDVLIATPQMMSKLGKYARTLGPKGLMPNPKSGTVTTDVEKAVKEAKAGRVDFRVDKYGIIHVAFGKVSFDAKALLENAEVIMKVIKDAKPASIKGEYVAKITVSTTMGPGIVVSSL